MRIVAVDPLNMDDDQTPRFLGKRGVESQREKGRGCVASSKAMTA